MSEQIIFIVGQSITWFYNHENPMETGTIGYVGDDGSISISYKDGTHLFSTSQKYLERDVKRSQKIAKQLARIYTVYTLADPRDDTIHYIGISQNVQSRFIQHLQCEGLNLEKNLWIQDLHRLGLRPVLLILETVTGSQQAHAREAHWIQHYLNQQAPLKNIDKVPSLTSAKAIRITNAESEL